MERRHSKGEPGGVAAVLCPTAGSALSNARGWDNSSRPLGRSEVEASTDGGGGRLTHLLQPVESVRVCRTAAASCTPVSYDAPSRCHAQSSTAFTACRRPTQHRHTHATVPQVLSGLLQSCAPSLVR